jgi:hypothetical protein
MDNKNLIDELLELSDPTLDNKIINTFKVKDSLCEDIFDKTQDGYKIKNEIREKLLEISDSFIDFTGVDFFIHDIILIGSLANYNWSEYSDVDLHIVVDMDELNDDTEVNSTVMRDIVKEFFDAKKNSWNEKHNVKIKNFDVELYVQDVDDEYVSSGVYSILNDEWVVEPSKKKENIDKDSILKKGEYFAKLIDGVIESSEDGKDVSDEIKTIKDKLKKFRKSGLESGGEFSYENLTFKLLRRNGYIGKLADLNVAIKDKKLSLS